MTAPHAPGDPTRALPAVALSALDTVHCMDALALLRGLGDASVNCIVTSPPYFGLRDYGVAGQIGLEQTPQEFVAKLVMLFREARRVLRDDGTLWVNMGDSYVGATSQHYGTKSQGNNSVIATSTYAAVPQSGRKERNQALYANGLKMKQLLGVPWRLAFGLQDDGWYLRSDIIWHKPNPMPESVTDRPTKAHEYIFLLSKSEQYFYDADAIKEQTKLTSIERGTRANSDNHKNLNVPGQKLHSLHKARANGDGYFVPTMRNKRSVWSVSTEQNSFAHFATFPQKLIEPMILAGCPVGGVVLDPFMGSGTTGLVAKRLGRHYIGCDISAEYVALAKRRLADTDPFQPTVLPTGDVQLSLFSEVAS